MHAVMEGGMFRLKSTLWTILIITTCVQATAQGLNKFFGGVNMCAEHRLYIIMKKKILFFFWGGGGGGGFPLPLSSLPPPSHLSRPDYMYLLPYILMLKL